MNKVKVADLYRQVGFANIHTQVGITWYRISDQPEK